MALKPFQIQMLILRQIKLTSNTDLMPNQAALYIIPVAESVN